MLKKEIKIAISKGIKIVLTEIEFKIINLLKMLSTKNYYSNPNLLKKIRIKSIAEQQLDEFDKVMQNSFTEQNETVLKQSENHQINNHLYSGG
jgi:hypothetical protein